MPTHARAKTSAFDGIAILICGFSFLGIAAFLSFGLWATVNRAAQFPSCQPQELLLGMTMSQVVEACGSPEQKTTERYRTDGRIYRREVWFYSDKLTLSFDESLLSRVQWVADR